MADAVLKVTADTRDAERALGRINSQLKLISGAALLSLGRDAVSALQSFADLSDEVTNLQNRLRTSLPFYQSAAQGFEDIYRIAQSAGAPLSAVGELYTKLALNGQALGLTQERIASATDTVTKAIQLSGAGAAQAQAGITQFGQALASGALQGDELRSILENTPVLAKAIADGLGITIGQLRRYGSEGKLSADVVLRALESQRGVIDTLSQSRVPTLEQAFNRLRNSLLNVFGQANDVSGAGSGLAKVISDLATSIDNATKNVVEFEIILKAIGISIGLSLIVVVGNAIAAIGGLGVILAKIGAVFAFLLTPLGLIGVAFGVIAGLVIRLQTELKYANMTFKEFFSLLTEGGLGNIISNFGKLQEKMAQNRAEIEATQKAERAKQKAIEDSIKAQELLTKQQEEFNKTFEKGIRPQEYELGLKRSSTYYSETELKVLLEINRQRETAISQGATLTASQQQRLRSVLEETAALERQAKFRADIISAGTSTITGAARAADPRIAVEQEYINAKVALENYFVENSLLTQAQYQETLALLQNEYEYQRYQASVALEDKLAQYRQAKFEEQLRQQQNILGMTVFGAEQAKQIAADKTAFEKKSEMEKTQFAIDQAADMFTALGKYNRQAFAAAKAFNIANAIMNTYMAATKALATYPPPFSFIAASAAVAMGLAQVAQISSQQYQGRAIGGPVRGNTPYVVGERGPELMVPQGAGRVVPNNQLSAGEPVVINLNIQAVDARGVDQLIMERKGMIVGMIRSAINDRGARAPL